MATKKQKREALEARKAIEAEEVRQSGLRALAQDRALRAKRAKEIEDKTVQNKKRLDVVKAMNGIALRDKSGRPTIIDEYPAVDLDMTAETC